MPRVPHRGTRGRCVGLICDTLDLRDHPPGQPREAAMEAAMSRSVNRRTLIKTGFGALAAPAILNVIPVNAQSRVIKIGHVSPRTGPIAPFGEADPYILEQIQKLVEKGISNGGRHYPVQNISKDSQSNTSRASEDAPALILPDKVQLIVAANNT